ncbi:MULTISPECIES: hypothetical protein [Burkholderia]|uniref:hypothetical protein n=1 Tax=Burkholderia TaxID=32008 RepID=UPI0011AF1020|nr:MULTISPECIES: hypothetical protein [unclassified Burkholderia]
MGADTVFCNEIAIVHAAARRLLRFRERAASRANGFGGFSGEVLQCSHMAIKPSSKRKIWHKAYTETRESIQRAKPAESLLRYANAAIHPKGAQ